MKRLRVRLRYAIPLAILLIPPLLWILILTITPTGWARTRIAAKLGEKTGRSVALGRIWIGVFGGVHLTDLEIGAPHSSRDPWLKVKSARINVSILQLLAGQIEPSEINVNGLDLRVLRRQDGTLELADLLRPASAHSSVQETEECPGPASLDIRLRDACVTVIDEPSRTHVTLTNVEGRSTCEGLQSIIHELRGTLNGGPFELAASLDRTPGGPVFDGHLQAHGVALDGMTSLLAYVVPVVSSLPDQDKIDGRLDLSVYLRGQGTSRSAVRRTLVGQGKLTLDPVTLDGSRLLAALDKMVTVDGKSSIGSVKTDFAIKNGRVRTDNLTLDLSSIPIVLSGWTDFDGGLDYRVRTEDLTGRLPDKAREFLADLAVDVKEFSTVRVAGTLDDMRVTLGDRGGREMPNGPGRPVDDREKLRDLGRRIRDRLLR